MFRKKRYVASEEQTLKDMKKLGVTQTQGGVNDSSGCLIASDMLRSPMSHQLLTQTIRLSERYQKLANKYQWLLSWCDTRHQSSAPAYHVKQVSTFTTSLKVSRLPQLMSYLIYIVL